MIDMFSPMIIFLPSSVTDRNRDATDDVPTTSTATSDVNEIPATPQGVDKTQDNTNQTFDAASQDDSTPRNEIIFSPEVIRPYAKAQPRKQAGRKRGKTMIATSTPEVKRIEDESEKRKSKNKRKELKTSVKKRLFLSTKNKQSTTNALITKNRKTKARQQTKKVTIAKVGMKIHPGAHSDEKERPTDDDVTRLNDTTLGSSTNLDEVEEDENDMDIDTKEHITYADSDDSDDIAEEMGDRKEQEKLDSETLAVDDYILVKYPGKKSVAHYFGKIVKLPTEVGKSGIILTKFFRRGDLHKSSTMTFSYPNDDYVFEHKEEDVIMKLPTPSLAGGTKRCAAKHIFQVDLSHYDPL